MPDMLPRKGIINEDERGGKNKEYFYGETLWGKDHQRLGSSFNRHPINIRSYRKIISIKRMDTIDYALTYPKNPTLWSNTS